MRDRLDRVPQIARETGLPRSFVRKHIALNTCPCGKQGASPCWRMGGEAACIVIAWPHIAGSTAELAGPASNAGGGAGSDRDQALRDPAPDSVATTPPAPHERLEKHL